MVACRTTTILMQMFKTFKPFSLGPGTSELPCWGSKTHTRRRLGKIGTAYSHSSGRNKRQYLFFLRSLFHFFSRFLFASFEAHAHKMLCWFILLHHIRARIIWARSARRARVPSPFLHKEGERDSSVQCCLVTVSYLFIELDENFLSDLTKTNFPPNDVRLRFQLFSRGLRAIKVELRATRGGPFSSPLDSID